MKRLLYIAMELVISISFIACGAKNSINANKINVTTANTKITYTKEFTYLPSYDTMQLYEQIPSTTKTPYVTAKYNIKNTTDARAFQDYESILKKDGWTITQDRKYYSISAKKNAHLATIVIQKYDANIRFIIISK